MRGTEPRKTRHAARARTALAWAAACLALSQLAVAGFLEWKHPEFYDPKYGCRLARLRERVASVPGRPLVVTLGSSRAEQGFRPGLLAAEDGPVLFNLARGGSSPLLHLVTLRRLLADGVRPAWVLLEVFPPSLVEDDDGPLLPKTTLRDLPVLSRYPVRRETYAYLARDRATLLYNYRSDFIASCAPALLSSPAERRDGLWDECGGEWREIGEGATPAERDYLTADARRRYFRKLQRFRVAAGADRALRELLDLCRAEGIGVVLFLMPESSEFRGWYPPTGRRRLSEYLATLRRDYRVPLIDAREWVADDEFWDSHHLLRGGATAFTRHFAAEVLSVTADTRANHFPRVTPVVHSH